MFLGTLEGHEASVTGVCFMPTIAPSSSFSSSLPADNANDDSEVAASDSSAQVVANGEATPSNSGTCQMKQSTLPSKMDGSNHHELSPHT
jgi:hypothetical protein